MEKSESMNHSLGTVFRINGYLLALFLVSFCAFSPIGFCVDYQEDGRVQSADTLAPANSQCTECDLQNDTATVINPVEQKSPSALPVIVYADRLFFDDKTGDAAAAGSVIIEYQGKKITADALFGNTQTKQGFVPGQTNVLGDRINIKGQDLYIDGDKQTANIKVFEGTIGTSYFSGESVDVARDKITLYNAIATGCPSNIPDYHVNADRMEVYPNDRIVLYNAHVFLKNFELFSLQQMTIMMGTGKSPVPYPSVGYWSDTGFWISEEVSLPLFVNNAYLDVELAYYQKYGFAPNASINYDPKPLQTELFVGFVRDDQGNWMKKLPDLSASTDPFKIGAVPIAFTLSGSAGVWQSPAQGIQSLHRMAQFYFQGDSIILPHDSTLALGTGGLGTWDGPVPEGILSSSQLTNTIAAFNSSILFDAVYNQTINKELSYALELHYQRESTQVFNFNNPGATVAGVWGVLWTPFKSDTFAVKQTVNVVTCQQTQLDTTWMHNWGCWNTAIVHHWSTGITEFNVTMTSW